MNLDKYKKELSDLSAFLGEDHDSVEFDYVSLVEDMIEDYESFDQTKYTVYIPSKGRADTLSMHKHCIKEGIPYKVVVEPQDADAYSETVGKDNLVILERNDQGIAYARTSIKYHSESLGEKYHWQMDDDMKHFSIRTGGKNVKVGLKNNIAIMEYVTELFDNIAISGMGNDVFAWSKPAPIKENQIACGCFLVNNSVDNYWRYGTVEDIDYTLMCLEKGYSTFVFSHIVFTSPPSGTNKGGNNLTDWQTMEKRKQFYEQFASLWPNNFTVVPLEKHAVNKGWKLQHRRRFLADYKQRPNFK